MSKWNGFKDLKAVNHDFSPSERVRSIAADVSRLHAKAVDQAARFPSESIDALRSGGLLAWRDLARPFPLREVALCCYELARHCASTALVYAMHQAQLAVLRAHGTGPWHRHLLEDIRSRQLLIGSSTSESGPPGALVPATAGLTHFQLGKQAPTISYGRQCDVLLATTRGCEAARHPQQVMVALLSEQVELQQQDAFVTAGMRGTCSFGYLLQARASAEQILPDDLQAISATTMLPVSHVLWASVWLGIAASALGRAREYVRRRRTGEDAGARRQHLGQAEVHYAQACAHVEWGLNLMEGNPRPATLGGLSPDMNLLKVSVSQCAIHVVTEALQTCGIAGYREDGPFSLGQHLRDVFSSSLMIHNDSLLDSIARMNSVAPVKAYPVRAEAR
jgi:acyl-CoA dehydrogenase